MGNGPLAQQNFSGRGHWFIIFNLIFQAEESRRYYFFTKDPKQYLFSLHNEQATPNNALL